MMHHRAGTTLQLCELSVLDGLPLRPLDLCRLGSTCSALRDLLSHAGSCALLWRQAALRTWGEAGAQCSSWSSARAHTALHLDFDSVTAFGSRVGGPSDEHASLELGSVLPYRVAAAVASLPISSARRRVVEWTVRIDALPKLEGVVLWMCAAVPRTPFSCSSVLVPAALTRTPLTRSRARHRGVLHDSRGSEAGDGAGSGSPKPRRLRHCRCSGVPHDAGCAARGATLRDALLPFVPNAPLLRGDQRGSAPRARTTLIERFSDCEWSLGGLGSNGWVYGAGLGGKRVGGMPGFGAGDEARVRLSLFLHG